MTCIIGINHYDSVVLAGDHLSSSLEDFTVFNGPAKTIDGPGYHIGLAGSSRVDTYIKKVLKGPKRYKKFTSTDDVMSFVDDLENAILDKGALQIEATTGTDFINYPFELILASKHGLWVIEADLSIYPITDFGAIGTGEPVALGALDVVHQLGITNIDETVNVVMTAVGNQVLNVGKKYWVRKIKK